MDPAVGAGELASAEVYIGFTQVGGVLHLSAGAEVYIRFTGSPRLAALSMVRKFTSTPRACTILMGTAKDSIDDLAPEVYTTFTAAIM